MSPYACNLSVRSKHAEGGLVGGNSFPPMPPYRSRVLCSAASVWSPRWVSFQVGSAGPSGVFGQHGWDALLRDDALPLATNSACHSEPRALAALVSRGARNPPVVSGETAPRRDGTRLLRPLSPLQQGGGLRKAGEPVSAITKCHTIVREGRPLPNHQPSTNNQQLTTFTAARPTRRRQAAASIQEGRLFSLATNHSPAGNWKLEAGNWKMRADSGKRTAVSGPRRCIMKALPLFLREQDAKPYS